MDEKLLQGTITQAQKVLEQSKDWNKTYEEQAKILADNKELLDHFYKQVKKYEGIQFYLTEVKTTQPSIFILQARYKGQPIATVSIAEDKTTIATKSYDESNKKIYNCDIQLQDKDIKAVETLQFLNFFNQDIKANGKINEQKHLQSMLLEEFGKTSSIGKLLLGCQPVKCNNLFYEIPIILNPKEEKGYINILTRTKVRKLTIIEPLTKDITPEMVLSNGTSKAVFLLNLLHSEIGQDWYKIMGFHGRVTPHLTIKVCIAVPKELKSKCKEFEPFELRSGTDSIEYHYLEYTTDGTQITSIKTTINE